MFASPKSIVLKQSNYALDILQENGLLASKHMHFHMEQKLKLQPDLGKPVADPCQYQRLIGRLFYLTVTWLDLSYLVQVLSQFIQDPRQPYLNVVVCILRYIKLSPSQGIFLPSTSALYLQAYCDLDWASCPTTCRSTSGYVVFLSDSPVSWKSKKQVIVSRFST